MFIEKKKTILLTIFFYVIKLIPLFLNKLKIIFNIKLNEGEYFVVNRISLKRIKI